MARKKSEFLGSFGKAFQVLKALTDEVLNLGGGDEDLRRIETDSGLRRKLADLIVGKSAESPDGIFKVTMDYGKSLQDMIAEGKYDWVSSDITEENFSLPKPPAGLPAKAELNLEMVHFNKCIASEKAIAELKNRGLRPATLPELLAFRAAYKEKQREFPIVALGSVWQNWRGDRHVPYLWGHSDRWILNLYYFGDGWNEGCRFLAVCAS